MDLDYLKIIVTIILAVIGWLIAHQFTSKRDIANKRREILLDYMIEAYKVLTNEVSHRKMDQQAKRNFENVLSDIQLFGTNEQVELAKKMAVDASKGEAFDLDRLVNCLRDDLRSQLNLSKVNGNVRWLRDS